MLRSTFLFFLIFQIYTQPIFAQNQSLQSIISFGADSKDFLGLQNHSRYSGAGNSKLAIRYELGGLSSKLALNYDETIKSNFDGSYLQYNSGIATYGLGAIDRHWSFSNKTSLILSHNARPVNSIYLKLEDKFETNWLPKNSNWSFEVFNGFTNGSLNNTDSMLLGARAILSPIAGLNFELVQTSQWGGDNYEAGLSALASALFMDTNDSSNSNINKMSGFGFSYLTNKSLISTRIYGQAIGEDEAGNLPSCYAFMAGLEWTNTKIKYPLTIGIETTDTRTKTTTHGNCGPNTFYNNSTYSYTNYGVGLGAEIDTESSSLELFGNSKISQQINIEYSTKLAIINDKNWSSHRLSTNRQSGLLNSIGVSWVKNNFKIDGNIHYQDFFLDKVNIKGGYGVGLSSHITF